MNARKNPLSLAVASLVLAATPAHADDPTVVYETVVPGYYLASGRGMAVDARGRAYLFARTIGNENDVLVLALDRFGGVAWTRYIDGEDHDCATGIALDAANDVWLTGWTDSADFPVKDGLDESLTGFREAFVMKLSGADGSILYSTFLGGDYVDEGADIAIDANGDVWLTGRTESTDFPTVNAIQGSLNGPAYAYSDTFVTKLSADGGTILYSTYLGGSKDEWAVGIAVDPAGRICVAGNTNSTDFPTHFPIQATNAGGGDAFAYLLSPDGSALEFGTYLGGEGWDRLTGMTMDRHGATYLGGLTRSVYFPTTPGAYQESFIGEIAGCDVPFGGHYNCEDAFVSKIAFGGAGLAYSTYLGGTRVDEGRDLAVDRRGRVRLVGYTTSPDFPLAGVDPDGAMIFVSELTADGSDLEYTFTVDSGSSNAGHGIAVDPHGNTYFTGAINVPADVYVAKLTTRRTKPFFSVR